MIKILLLSLLPAFGELLSNEAKIIDVEQLEEIISTPDDKIQVINFWATWCGPCIKELPVFEKVWHEQRDIAEVTLVTVNFAEDIEKVNRFIEKKKLQSRVLLIDNVDYNAWIDKVDETWSGAIPATLIINTKTKQRRFVEGQLDEGRLESIINQLI